jgi:hypothetical protein
MMGRGEWREEKENINKTRRSVRKWKGDIRKIK